jgi:orotidine-5'-phosphate decarboxylase
MNTGHAEKTSAAAAARAASKSSYDGGPRVIVALDFPEASEALALAARLEPASCAVKVGKELFTSAGPALVSALVGRGFRVFLDLKYHDIPNTVATAVHEAARLGVSMLTVHAAGGGKMLRAAVDAARASHPALIILGVTVLTSLDQNELEKVGFKGTVPEEVLRLAALALDNGCKGIVTSARETAAVRAELGHNFAIVTPGVRPPGSSHGDQARVATPAEAIAGGATHIVVGRPITEAADPPAAARAILKQISS